MNSDAPAAHWEIQTSQPTTMFAKIHICLIFLWRSLYRYHVTILYLSGLLWKHYCISWTSTWWPVLLTVWCFSVVKLIFTSFISGCMFTCDLDHVCGLPWGCGSQEPRSSPQHTWIWSGRCVSEKLSFAAQGFVFCASLFMLLGH